MQEQRLEIEKMDGEEVMAMTGIVRYGAVLAGIPMLTIGMLSLPGPASAQPEGTVVCFSPTPAPTPALLPSLPALPGLSRVGVLPSPALGAPIGAAPGPSLPSVIFLTPQPTTGALVVPLSVPVPSAPGVSLLTPHLIAPPAMPSGQASSVATAQSLTLLLGTSAHQRGPSMPPVSCF